MAYIGQGRLIAVGRNDRGALYQINSSDYGRTWTQFSTNISDCRFNCAFPLYFADSDLLTLYYNDRYSNSIKKRTVRATFVYNNPNQWTEATVIDYTSSPTTRIDSGYITSCRIREYRNETISCLYTTRDVYVDVDTPKRTGIVIFYDTVESPKTSITKDNLFVNGGFSTWQYGTRFTATDRTPVYTASQWIIQGAGTRIITKSFSPLLNKPTLKISATTRESPVRLYQPLMGLTKTTFTLTARLNVPDQGDARVKLLAKWIEGETRTTSVDLDNERIVSGYRTLSFTFQCPAANPDTPLFLGLEMVSKQDLFIYDMKLESGYAFTGFNETDLQSDQAKCRFFYEEWNGIYSAVANRDGNLLHTIAFGAKHSAPKVSVFWNDELNTACAREASSARTTNVNVETTENLLRLSGTKPTGISPVSYDIDKIILDARIFDE
jgi:hypothetical protein